MWLLTNPNPSDNEKNEMAQEIGITVLQLNILLTHKRYGWLNNRGPLETSSSSKVCYHYPSLHQVNALMASQTFQMWLLLNQNPSDDEKNQMAQEIGITVLQLNILLTHKRLSLIHI